MCILMSQYRASCVCLLIEQGTVLLMVLAGNLLIEPKFVGSVRQDCGAWQMVTALYMSVIDEKCALELALLVH